MLIAIQGVFRGEHPNVTQGFDLAQGRLRSEDVHAVSQAPPSSFSDIVLRR